jgi:DNA (cytosine-5)-methyltransferase 1
MERRNRDISATFNNEIDADIVYAERIKGNLLRSPVSFKLIDLFAGAGGLTLGFTKLFGHNFTPIWANDYNVYATKTYNANFGDHCIPGDIVDILDNPEVDVPIADVVIGGPPCQGFSLLNKNKVDDPRKQLWRPYFEVVRRSEASIFVMENVPQLLDSYEFQEIRQEANTLGYEVASQILCAADYGVAQRRYRAFVIGCNFADPKDIFPPKRTHYNPNTTFMKSLFKSEGDYLDNPQPWRTVRDEIGDLLPPEGVEIRKEAPPYDLHFGRTPTEKSLARYQVIPEEGMNRFDLQRLAPELTPDCWIRKKSGGTDLFGRLWWDRPAFTIRTEFFKPEKGRYLHPSQHRPITHREAARIQSFPDAFRFLGSKIEIAKQIGNAVPPRLTARVADIVYALLLRRQEVDNARHVHSSEEELDYVQGQKS